MPGLYVVATPIGNLADITLRATNVNINAPVQAIDVLSVGPSLALVNSFFSAFPGRVANATGYAVVGTGVRAGQIVGTLVPGVGEVIAVPPGFRGQGYDRLSPPTVTIAPPPAGPGAVQATAMALVENGAAAADQQGARQQAGPEAPSPQPGAQAGGRP